MATQLMPLAQGQGEVLPALDVYPPERQRRWTVLLRMLLLIPQYIVLTGVGIAVLVVMTIAWFAALVMGRLPAWCTDFLGWYLEYSIRVNSYLFMLVDTYPPFGSAPPDYPVSVKLAPGQLNRAAVLFRVILFIPAYLMTVFLSLGWRILALFFWLAVLILGRTPQPVFEASAAIVRYKMRTFAYFMMLTSAYPKRLFGDPPPTQMEYPIAPASEGKPMPMSSYPSSTRPLLLSRGGAALLMLIIVLGILDVVQQNLAPRHYNTIGQNRPVATAPLQ
jgi:hypothetical protein